MSQTVAIRPSHGHRLPGRFLAIVVAIAFVIATTVAVLLLVSAVRDSGESTPNPVPAAGGTVPGAGDFSHDVCVLGRVATPC